MRNRSEILVEELEPIKKDSETSRLDEVKLEMQERLNELKNE